MAKATTPRARTAGAPTSGASGAHPTAVAARGLPGDNGRGTRIAPTDAGRPDCSRVRALVSLGAYAFVTGS